MKGRKELALLVGVVVISLVLIEVLSILIEYSLGQVDTGVILAENIPEKEEDELRIFVYGGSTVQGEPLPEVGFVEQLRFLLNRSVSDKSVRVFNFGEGGAPSSLVLKKLVGSIDQRVDAVVVYSGHNEFLSELSEKELIAVHAIREKLYRFAFARLLKRFLTRYYLAQRRSYLMGDDLHPDDRHSADYKDRQELFKANLETIISSVQARDIPLILCTVASNVGDWPPVEREKTSGEGGQSYEGTLRNIEDLIRVGKLTKADSEVQKGLSEFPGDAMLLYLRGQLELNRSSFNKARNYLKMAKDADPFPWRVLSYFNDVIRSKRDEPLVSLVDIERIFEEYSSGGIIGFPLIVDNCHPTPKGNFLIATAVYRKLVEAGLINVSPAANADVTLNTFLEGIGYFDSPRTLEIEYLSRTARYCMKPPFFKDAVSRRYLDNVRAIDPDRWEIWANLGSISLLEGNVPQGISELKQALVLKRGPLDLKDREKLPYLKEALEAANLSLEDLKSK